MKVSEVVAGLEADMEESQNQRDKRVEELWTKLDPQRHGELDLKGLQKGLRRIDHREPMPIANSKSLCVSSSIAKHTDTKVRISL